MCSPALPATLQTVTLGSPGHFGATQPPEPGSVCYIREDYSLMAPHTTTHPTSAVNLLISHDATQDALPQRSRTTLGMSLILSQSSQLVTSSPCFQHPLSQGVPAESCLSFCTVHTPRSTVLLWLPGLFPKSPLL